MSSYSVNVSGIAPTTTEVQLHDFFTFCGKINHIDKKDKVATIQFEKPSAAKTALMLNGGNLDGATLSVTSDEVHPDNDHHDGGNTIDQSDKPRAGIAAEYLARGYTLSDHILERAIEIDNKQGISKRFLNFIQGLDKSVGERALGPEQTISGRAQATAETAVQHARTMDEQKGFTKTANDYYAKAMASPLGLKVKEFYTTTSKQVRDIHEEARRIAAEEKAKSGGVSPPSQHQETNETADKKEAAPTAA